MTTKKKTTSKKMENGESPLTMIDPKMLVPWERNPRKNEHAVEPVAESIKRFGFAAPIVARASDRRVLAGHTRLKAALSLGLDVVPVRWLDLDDRQADAYTLADNRLGELAEWDDDLLVVVLRELEEERDGLGWSEKELVKFLATVEADDAEDDHLPQFDLTYRIIVECSGEEDQQEKLERLEAEGYKCQLLIS